MIQPSLNSATSWALTLQHTQPEGTFYLLTIAQSLRQHPMSWFLYPCSMFWNWKNWGLPILLSTLRWFCGGLGRTSHWWSTCLVCGRPWLWHSALKKVLVTVMLQILSYKSRPYYQFSQQRQLDSGRVHWICRSVCIAILTSFKLWTRDAVPVCSFFFHSFHVICGFQCTSRAFPSLKCS